MVGSYISYCCLKPTFWHLEIHGWNTIVSLLGPGLCSGTMLGLRSVIDHIKSTIHVGKDAIQPTDPLYMLRCFLPKRSKNYLFLRGGCRYYVDLEGGGPIINVCTWWLVDVSLQLRFIQSFVRMNSRFADYLWGWCSVQPIFERKNALVATVFDWTYMCSCFFPPKYWVQASPHWSFSTDVRK